MTRFGALVTAVALLMMWCGSAWAQPQTGATADLRDRNNTTVASAEFAEEPDQVLITLTFPRQSPLTGTHAIRILAGNRCTPPDFSDAGAIFNPFGKEHGLRNQAGPMAGDLPDIVLGDTGLVRYTVAAPLATLRPGPASLLGPGGTSIAIDTGQDDNTSQPAGNSGSIIACGVIYAPGTAPVVNTPSVNFTPILIGIIGALLILAGLALRWTWPRRLKRSGI